MQSITMRKQVNNVINELEWNIAYKVVFLPDCITKYNILINPFRVRYRWSDTMYYLMPL